MKTYILDPVGHLLLALYHRVPEDDESPDPQCIFHVSSQVTRLASPVLGDRIVPAILTDLHDSASVELAPAGNLARLRLYGDNEATLLIVLQAAHLHTQLIPSEVSFDLFHQIAVVCHKFNMARTLLPWPSISSCGLAHRTTHVPECLEIAWVFHKTMLFEEVTRTLVIQSTFDGNSLAMLGCSYTRDIVPARVLEVFQSNRLRVISAMFSASKTLLEAHTNAASTGHNICKVRFPKKPSNKSLPRAQRNTKIRDQCDTVQADILIPFLKSVGFFPVQREMDHRSIHEIVKAIAQAARHRRRRTPAGDRVRCCVLHQAYAEIWNLMGSCEGLALSDFIPDTSILYRGFPRGILRW